MPIPDDVWNDLIEMEPGESKNRAPLAARWGGDAMVQELIEAGHSEGRRRARESHQDVS